MRRNKPKSRCPLPCAIQEYYKEMPPVDARRTVEKLLVGIPCKYLDGLAAVVLCDTASFKERYGDEENIPTARYLARKADRLPWIEICVDILVGGLGVFPLRIPFVRDLIFSEPVYHEVGHHIHYTQVSKNEDPEADAEKWRKKLQMHYLLRKHWFITIPLLIITAPFRRQLDKLCEFSKSKLS